MRERQKKLNRSYKRKKEIRRAKRNSVMIEATAKKRK